MNDSQLLSEDLFGLLDAATQRDPGAPFLIESDRTLAFEDVHLSARRLAGWFREEGVGRGDRVAICCRNRSEIAIAVFAAALVGAVFVVLNSRLRPHGIQKILDQAEPKAILTDDDTAALFDEAVTSAARLHVGSDDHGTSWAESAEATPLDPGDWPGIDVDPVSLVFTSGSTADPRGVTLSHANIRFVTRGIQQRLQYERGDVVGCFLPLAFDYGLYQIFLAAQSGAALYIGDPAQVGPRLPKILKEAEVSVLPGVPAVFAALIAMFERRPYDLPRLRKVTNTGERLPLAYIEQLEVMFAGLEVFPMYGLTECKRVSVMLPAERLTRPASVGRPLDGTEVYAVDEDGERLAPGEVGELVVRGRHIAHGYWRAPDETARRFKKRAPEMPVELFTGDRGSVDAEGFIYFAARADDLMKHRGNRISPVEIEAESCAVPGVVEATVVKRSADDTLHLFVTLSDLELTEQAILGELNQKLEPFKVPDFVVIETELPKSINGKIDRKALLSRVENRDPQHPSSHETIPQAAGV